MWYLRNIERFQSEPNVIFVCYIQLLTKNIVLPNDLKERTCTCYGTISTQKSQQHIFLAAPEKYFHKIWGQYRMIWTWFSNRLIVRRDRLINTAIRLNWIIIFYWSKTYKSYVLSDEHVWMLQNQMQIYYNLIFRCWAKNYIFT